MATLGDLVRRTVDELFVDREQELRQIQDWLQDSSPARPLVVAIHGPGGVGKTTLLQRVEALAKERGLALIRLDGRDFAPTIDGLLAALEATDPTELAKRMASQPTLLMIDAFEYVDALAPALQRSVLPVLPDAAKVLIAGRRRLEGADWRDWLPRIRTIALAALPPDRAREFLARRGVADSARQAAIVRVTQGLPLALAIAADVASTRELPEAGSVHDGWRPVLARLVEDLLEETADPRVRSAVEAASVVRRFDEGLLAELIGTDAARGAMPQLGSLSFVSRQGDLLTVHEEVRAIVGDGLRGRDPDRFEQYVRRAAAAYERVARTEGDAGRRERLLIDGLALHEHRDSFPSPAQTAGFRVERARQDDGAAILAVLADFVSNRRQLAATMSADERDPHVIEDLLRGDHAEFYVCRGGNGGVAAYAFVLPISEPVRAMLPAGGELRRLTEQWRAATAHAYFMSTIVFASGAGEIAQHALGEFGLQQCLRGGQFLFLSSDARYTGLLQAAGARFIGVDPDSASAVAPKAWLLDIDAFGADEWMAAMVAGRPPVARPRGAELEQALRGVLARWHDDDALAASPLIRLVPGEGATPGDLRAYVREVMRRAAADRRAVPGIDALDRAYLDRTGSVEDVAERLHVSRATLFRLLRRGVRDVARQIERDRTPPASLP